MKTGSPGVQGDLFPHCWKGVSKTFSKLDVIYQALRRELKIRRAAEYF